MKKIYLFILLSLIVGCTSKPEVDSTMVKTLTKAYAVVIVTNPYIVDDGADTSHSRNDCPYKDNNWNVVHGDGHVTKCPNCVPSWTESKDACCLVCGSCSCTCDDCKCKYPSQCASNDQANLDTPIVTLTAEDRETYFKKKNIRWNTPNKKCCPNCPSDKCTCLFIGQALMESANGFMPDTGYIWPKEAIINNDYVKKSQLKDSQPFYFFGSQCQQCK